MAGPTVTRNEAGEARSLVTITLNLGKKGGFHKSTTSNKTDLSAREVHRIYLQPFGLGYNRYTQKWRISIDGTGEEPKRDSKGMR
jgi:hypothetical protein